GHFVCQSGWKPNSSASAMLRIRRCVECQKCFTRYVVSRTPYENGSYLLPTIAGCWEEYSLYCRCKAAATLCRSSDFEVCEVSAGAFERGYGTDEEIRVIRAPQREYLWGVSRRGGHRAVRTSEKP